LHDERRFQIDEAMIGQEAGHHIGVLRRGFCGERGQCAGRQAEVEADGEDVPGTHARPDPDDLRMLVLVGNDLIEEWKNRGVAAVHEREPADLDDVQVGQDGADGRLRAGDDLLVHQRFAHQRRHDVLGARIVHAGVSGANSAL
jgi:hypothetical protein